MNHTARLIALGALTALIGPACTPGHTTLPARQLNEGEFALSGNLEVSTPNVSIQGLYGTGSADFGLGLGTSIATWSISGFGRAYLGADHILGAELMYTQGTAGGVPIFSFNTDTGFNGSLPFSTVKLNPRYTTALKTGQFLYFGAQAELTGSIFDGNLTTEQGLHFNGAQAGFLVGVDIFNPFNGVGIQGELKLLPLSVWSYNPSDAYQFGVFPFQSNAGIGPSALEITTTVYIRTNNEAAPPPPSIEEDDPATPPPSKDDGGGAIPTDAPPPPPPIR